MEPLSIAGIAAAVMAVARLLEAGAKRAHGRWGNGAKPVDHSRLEAIERRMATIEDTCAKCLSNGGVFIRHGEFRAWKEGWERDGTRMQGTLERLSADIAKLVRVRADRVS